MKIHVNEKVLWKYVLCYLNNENCCLKQHNQTSPNIFPFEFRKEKEKKKKILLINRKKKEKKNYSVPYTLSSWNQNYSSGPSSHSNKISIAGSTAK